MADFLNTMIQGVGGMANGALDNLAAANGEAAKARATIQEIKNTNESLAKMERDARIKITNGLVETAGQVRI